MKKRDVLLPLAVLLIVLTSCGLSSEAVSMLTSGDSGAGATQTLLAIQWQILSAWQSTQTALSAIPGTPSAQTTDTGTLAMQPSTTSSGTLSPTIPGTPAPSSTLTQADTSTSSVIPTKTLTQTATSTFPFTPTVTLTASPSPTNTPAAASTSTTI